MNCFDRNVQSKFAQSDYQLLIVKVGSLIENDEFIGLQFIRLQGNNSQFILLQNFNIFFLWKIFR